ncbi:MAG: sterol desaturase family protein [Bacteroidota bacterium]
MQFPIEKKHSLSNKLFNIFFTIILILSGAVLVGLINSIIPFQPRQLVDKGIIHSILMALLYIFITDFIFYWYHRAQHRFKYLWVIHELHHSDNELNVTTSMRTYWLERPIQALLISIPISFIVGLDSRGIKIFSLLLTAWLFFTHANLKIRLGFFTRILCGPQVHRIHHSNLAQHQGKNFAQFFPVIDILFGTYYHPQQDEFPSTGLMEKTEDLSIFTAMIKPFTIWFNFLK